MGASIEFIYWEQCPSHQRALTQLREAMGRYGLSDNQLEIRAIATDEQAVQERFVGSPTIRVDGRDVVEPDDGQPYVLGCRLYRHRDGRPSPLPDQRDLDDALAPLAGSPSSRKGEHQ